MRISDWSSDVCSSDLKGHGDAYDDGARGDDLTVALFFFVAAVFVLEVRDGFEDGESLGGQGRDKQAVTDLGGQSQAGRGACEEARASPRGAARGAEHTAPNSADDDRGKCEPRSDEHKSELP